MHQSFVVIDDFYDRPDSIRDHALCLEFRRKQRATYPGREAVDGRNWEEVRRVLRDALVDDVDGACPKEPPFPQGKFRLALEQDQRARVDFVHHDIQPWSGVVYLSRDEDCEGRPAVGFYRHRPTGATRATEVWKDAVLGPLVDLDPQSRWERFWQHMRDPDHWEELEWVNMAYNRVVLLDAHRFHASRSVFGDRPHNGRLTQHFEFYASPERP